MMHNHQAVLQKLMDQSDILRNMQITLDITSEVENASANVLENKIKINPDYLKSVKEVAPTLSHELAHIVYYNIYGFKSNKEDEIFADVYGMILCKRAGFDVSKFKDEWNEKLQHKENPDEHPQNKIRYYILKRMMSYLEDFNVVKINGVKQEKKHDYMVSSFDISIRRERLRQKFGLNEDETRATSCNTTDISKLELSAVEFRNELLDANLLCLPEDSLYDIGKRVLSEEVLAQDYQVLEKVHNTLTKAVFGTTDCGRLKRIILQSEEKMMSQLENMRHQENAQTFGECVEKLLLHKNRFTLPQSRKQLQKWYIESLVQRYGIDDGSSCYTEKLKSILDKLNNELHSADVLPLMRDIKETLQLQDRNIPLLQLFVRNNEQITKQIRMETLATECLLNSDQALKTVQYLSDSNLKPFHLEGFYGNCWYNDYTRKDEPLFEPSFVNKEDLQEICEDMVNITPKKRAEIFCLLMENISPADNMHKLELFVNKTTENDSLYKVLVEEYIKTYNENQQPYVVASLVSKKNRNQNYSYEDYFKLILENSGIDGIRSYNAIYADKKTEEIISLDTNRTALHSKDMIIFSNLRKLGQKIAQHTNTDIRKIGQTIMQATHKSVARPLLSR